MQTNVGANIGDVLAEAMGETVEKPDHEVHLDLRVVAIEMAPQYGNVTMFATEFHEGRVLVGPQACEYISDINDFAHKLWVTPLRYNRVAYLDRGKRLGNPSFICEFSNIYSCPNRQCTVAPWKPTPQQEYDYLADLRMKRVEPKKCPRCQGNPMLKHFRIIPDKPTPETHGDLIEHMFDAYRTFDQIHTTETVGMVPRVWGVYDARTAPTSWMPTPSDWLAQEIEMRLSTAPIDPEAAKGFQPRTIRPWKQVSKARTDIVSDLFLEGTVDHDFKPSWRVGWMSEASLYSEALSSHYGFLVRLARRPEEFIHRKPRQQHRGQLA